MNLRLVVIDGAMAGASFALTTPRLTIGRGATSVVVLDDPLVSREHCRLDVEDGTAVLVDLDSRNGTFVNRVPVLERRLETGDRVAVGRTVFLVVDDDDASSTDSTNGLAFADTSPTSTVLLAAELGYDVINKSDRPAVGAETPDARELRALLSFASRLAGGANASEIYEALVGFGLEVTHADRCAVIDARTDSSLAAAWREQPPGARFAVSRHLVERVRRDGPMRASGFQGRTPDSLDGAAAAVPVGPPDEPRAILYAHAAGRDKDFGDSHLRLLAAAAEAARHALDAAFRVERLEEDARRLRADLEASHAIVGESEPVRRLLALVRKVAAVDSTVLIRGESGTGKELVARAIHDSGPRKAAPFVALNCAAISETLLESELFGHEKGAFTGASALHRGRLETASGGTVFLDEVGELAPRLQAKLLRAIQERSFERVGGTKSVRVDVRWLAATNADLERGMAEGAFRRDLYHRLNVITIAVPPLRDRKKDVALLAVYFAARIGNAVGRRVARISDDALACLVAYDWPGNVRELENVIERAVVLGEADEILVEDLPTEVIGSAPALLDAAHPFEARVHDFKRSLLTRALEETGGDYPEAARRLGLHPRYIYRLARTLGLWPGAIEGARE